MPWACRYAAANRAAILNALADLLEGCRGIAVAPESFVDSPHNTAGLREHSGERLVVHRKSANHAAAGRVMSRAEAGRRVMARDLESRMRGIVFQRRWAGRFRDEAPQAYRDLHEVMQAQRDLVRTSTVLVPMLNDKRP